MSQIGKTHRVALKQIRVLHKAYRCKPNLVTSAHAESMPSFMFFEQLAIVIALAL